MKGSGGLYRLHPDNTMEVLVKPGTFLGMPFNPRRAPSWFGAREGHIFTTGQRHAGRQGAQSGHVIFALPSGETRPDVFAEIPENGTLGGGIPGILMIGGFGPKDSPYAGYYYCNSWQNHTIYRVDNTGHVDVVATLDGEHDGPSERVEPYFVFWAKKNWGEHEGKMMVAGPTGRRFYHSPEKHWNIDFYVFDDHKINPEPVARGANLGLAMVEIAPPEFEPFGGHVFYVDFGRINQVHDDTYDDEHTKFVDDDGTVNHWGTGPLPYDERIMRIDENGEHHVFADGLQAGWNEIRFSGDRMVLSNLRRSYSSGQYHIPDGSLEEIRVAR
jgi:hypothetical protein